MPAESRPRVLVVDDRFEMAEMLAEGLSDHGYDAAASGSGRSALSRLEGDGVDALVTDLRMPGVDGLELLAASQRTRPERPVIVMTAFGAVETAVESIRRGAYHYLVKPFKLEELVLFLDRAFAELRVRDEASTLRRTLRARTSPEIVGESRALRDLLTFVDRVADADAPVLITGETGTGKGVIARALHARGRRLSQPFVTVNCAAVPEALLESELFGHVRGAFTGATRDRPGLFVEAHGGVLFLDEIGEMSPSLQAKLLHALERRLIRPVGGAEREVDVRTIAATHQDLEARVAAGTFRADLLYRLDVVRLHVPPLRERAEDVPSLVEHFLAAARRRNPGSVVRGFTAAALQGLATHPWPGNVRELAHLVERVVLLADKELVDRRDLPFSTRSESVPPTSAFGELLPVRVLHQRYAQWALAQLGGHRGRTAERLGIDGKTLAKWLAEEP